MNHSHHIAAAFATLLLIAGMAETDSGPLSSVGSAGQVSVQLGIPPALAANLENSTEPIP